MAPIIDIQGLSKIYVQDFLGVEHGRLKLRLKNRKRVALRPLTLQVQEGEIFGLLGPNGAGKTTTLKILMGLHFPTAGSATIMGRPLGDKSVKEQIGFLPENPYFYDYLRGEEFLDYYGQLYGMSKQKRRKRIPELLEQVGLTNAADLPLRGYSKGMLQRAGLAQALLNDPKIVFLDEPQSGLDPFGRKEVRDLILSLRDAGKTVFFSSHILQDAEVICDRVAILHKGERIALGPLSEMLSAKIKEYEVTFSDTSPAIVEQARTSGQRFVERPNEFLAVFPQENRRASWCRKFSPEVGSCTPSSPGRKRWRNTLSAKLKENAVKKKRRKAAREPSHEQDFRDQLQYFKEAVRNRILYVLLFFSVIIMFRRMGRVDAQHRRSEQDHP